MPDPQPEPDLPRGKGPVIVVDSEIVFLDESNALQFTPEEEEILREYRRKRREAKNGRTLPPPEPPAEPN